MALELKEWPSLILGTWLRGRLGEQGTIGHAFVKFKKVLSLQTWTSIVGFDLPKVTPGPYLLVVWQMTEIEKIGIFEILTCRNTADYEDT